MNMLSQTRVLVIDRPPADCAGALRWLLLAWESMAARGMPVQLLLHAPDRVEYLLEQGLGEALSRFYLSDFPQFNPQDVLVIPDWESRFLRESAHLKCQRMLFATTWSSTLKALSPSICGDFAPEHAMTWHPHLGGFLKKSYAMDVRFCKASLPGLGSTQGSQRPVVLLENGASWSPYYVRDALRRSSDGQSLEQSFRWVDTKHATPSDLQNTAVLLMPDAACPSPEAAQAMREGCVVLAFHRREPDACLRMGNGATNAILMPWGDMDGMIRQCAGVLDTYMKAPDQLQPIERQIREDVQELYPVGVCGADWF